MPFYAHPSNLLSPGDIFPEIPFPVLTHPLKLARKRNPPGAGGGADNFREVYTSPVMPPNSRLELPEGEESLAHTRLAKALFITWGSDVENDERGIAERGGRVQRRSWIAAPIFRVDSIPENQVAPDPETNQPTAVRDLIRSGKVLESFYLPPFPGFADGVEYYAAIRKMTNIGVQYFREAMPNRIATLSEPSSLELWSQLMWCLTRAEFFFRPIVCECGRRVLIHIPFEGQNIGADPWE